MSPIVPGQFLFFRWDTALKGFCLATGDGQTHWLARKCNVCSAWKANASVAYWIRVTSGLDNWMPQLSRLRFTRFYITLNVFFLQTKGEGNSYYHSSHLPWDFWATALTSTLCLLLKICLCVQDWLCLPFSHSGALHHIGAPRSALAELHHKAMFSSMARSRWKPAWPFQ